MKSIRVFAPASVANLGCGFDVMGMVMDAVGDLMCVGIDEGLGLDIENRSGVPLPANVEDNVITPAIMAFLASYGKPMKVKVIIESKIHPGSGIGSSAASSSAAVFALNELLGKPFSIEKLVEFAMEGEKLISGGVAHADNVAPCLMGGVVLIRGYKPLDMIKLPVPPGFHCSVAHPDIMVSTKMAREVMPKEIPVRDAVRQWGNVGGLVAGLTLGDIDLVGRSMVDIVAEPCRKSFIPGFEILRDKVLKDGALAMNIAGSGPSVFALSKDDATAVKVAEIMKEHFAFLGIDSRVYTASVSDRGARVAE
ncbi:MAG: homoserine kinase [Bacteroidales bacterium]|nr:homoserine kinase [Bacteroidales bacterium]